MLGIIGQQRDYDFAQETEQKISHQIRLPNLSFPSSHSLLPQKLLSWLLASQGGEGFEVNDNNDKDHRVTLLSAVRPKKIFWFTLERPSLFFCNLSANV